LPCYKPPTWLAGKEDVQDCLDNLLYTLKKDCQVNSKQNKRPTMEHLAITAKDETACCYNFSAEVNQRTLLIGHVLLLIKHRRVYQRVCLPCLPLLPMGRTSSLNFDHTTSSFAGVRSTAYLTADEHMPLYGGSFLLHMQAYDHDPGYLIGFYLFTKMTLVVPCMVYEVDPTTSSSVEAQDTSPQFLPRLDVEVRRRTLSSPYSQLSFQSVCNAVYKAQIWLRPKARCDRFCKGVSLRQVSEQMQLASSG
jgi:hypothetical protein